MSHPHSGQGFQQPGHPPQANPSSSQPPLTQQQQQQLIQAKLRQQQHQKRDQKGHQRWEPALTVLLLHSTQRFYGNYSNIARCVADKYNTANRPCPYYVCPQACRYQLRLLLFQYKKRVEEQHNRIKDEAAKKAKAKELAEKVTNSEDGKTEPGSETESTTSQPKPAETPIKTEPGVHKDAPSEETQSEDASQTTASQKDSDAGVTVTDVAKNAQPSVPPKEKQVMKDKKTEEISPINMPDPTKDEIDVLSREYTRVFVRILQDKITEIETKLMSYRTDKLQLQGTPTGPQRDQRVRELIMKYKAQSPEFKKNFQRYEEQQRKMENHKLDPSMPLLADGSSVPTYRPGEPMQRGPMDGQGMHPGQAGQMRPPKRKPEEVKIDPKKRQRRPNPKKKRRDDSEEEEDMQHEDIQAVEQYVKQHAEMGHGRSARRARRHNYHEDDEEPSDADQIVEEQPMLPPPVRTSAIPPPAAVPVSQDEVGKAVLPPPRPDGVNPDDVRELLEKPEFFRLVTKHLVDILSKEDEFDIFAKPVPKSVAPKYDVYVKRRMDISAIKKNLSTGKIKTFEEFQVDVEQIFYNAKLFNQEGDQIYSYAENLQKKYWDHSEETLLKLMRCNLPGMKELIAANDHLRAFVSEWTASRG
eukprot:TRINITY_DN3099_c0_g1_i2.p1 TRINITY_DN3099_c0_g1~~TRINITY_DN3099_c0_g1_i2.p1  ORF type:complete len:641 (+),score=164.12 TRINITY_DN3099_c0_g1_i2:114-2036(+)